MLGGIWGWLVEHLFEPIFEHLVEMGFETGLALLLSKIILVGMGLAFAVSLVLVLIALLVDSR